jgi:cyclic dehypoxanthinyl futalosine synthase
VVHDDPANDPVDDHVVSHFASTALPGGGVAKSHPELKLIDAS